MQLLSGTKYFRVIRSKMFLWLINIQLLTARRSISNKSLFEYFFFFKFSYRLKMQAFWPLLSNASNANICTKESWRNEDFGRTPLWLRKPSCQSIQVKKPRKTITIINLFVDALIISVRVNYEDVCRSDRRLGNDCSFAR